MTTYDPRRNERASDKRKQTRPAVQDVDMIDAPPGECNEPFRAPPRPRKIEIRSDQGSAETRQGVRRDDDRIRPVSTRDYSYVSHATYETKRRSQSAYTRQGSQGSMFPERSTAKQSKRHSDDDGDWRRYRREQELRWDAEDKLKALEETVQLLKSDLEAETGRRVRAEKDFCDSDSRLAAHVQNSSQITQSSEDNLRKQEFELTSARERLELKEKQCDSEREQWLSERQCRDSERQQWEFERQQWESKGKQYDADLKDIKSRWKQAAKELNGLRAQGRGFYQVTDNYLCDLITQLRYKIRDFGIQYFSEKFSKRPKFVQNGVWKEYMVPTTRDERYLDLVNCSETRPSVIQAFMWNLIFHEIFCKYKWAGPASLPVVELCKNLESCMADGTSSPADIEATRRLHTWRATTVGLLLDSMNQQKRREADSELQRWKDRLHIEVESNLSLLRAKGQKDCQRDFFDIIDEAVKIDKEISRQVSRVTWSFGVENGAQALDPAIMDLRTGEAFVPNSEVTLVTSPGVIKQGKSTGEGFESSIYLLKMEVSCEVPGSRL
jgi:hypothetical protein